MPIIDHKSVRSRKPESSDQWSRRSLTVLLPLIAVIDLSVNDRAFAAAAPTEEQLIGRCIADTAKGRQWLRLTLWGLRDQEGGRSGSEILNANGTHDLGPLQINSSWVPRIALATGKSEADVRSWLMHDVCFNVRTANWLFLTALATTNDYWKAVGLYHSRKVFRQRSYATSVASKLQKRFGARAFARVQAPVAAAAASGD